MPELLPFHKWKEQIMAEDRKIHGCQFFRARDWYWKAYGGYCNKVRSS